jgi:2-polyprenyl-6-methoxyphenol hydroxylase-like FAD-dependent oxidoreductase
VSLHAIVAGAGIGGLSAAVALRNAGVDVTVLEREPRLAPAGAGIWLWPNAIHALRSLGVGERVVTAALPVGLTVRAAGGRLLADTGSAEFPRRFGAPLVVLHRADLHEALAAGAGPGTIRLGAECVAVRQDARGVTVELRDGVTLRGDVLIGADGLHSAVRTALHGNQKPRFSGYTAWRAVTPLPDALVPRVVDCKYTGRGRIFVTARLADGSLFWAATGRATPGERRDAAADRRSLLTALADWADPVRDVVAATDPARILRHDLHDRPPLERWSHGRVTLVGDAAHPMLPNLGQGACQAIEDAVALGRALSSSRDPVAALDAYEAERRGRAVRIARQSRRMARLEHVDGRVAERLRNAVMRALPSTAPLRQLAPIVGHYA